MTHINRLENEAVGGPQPQEMALLHIYSQPCEHFEARIVGNKAGLRELYDVIGVALNVGELAHRAHEVFATDGEGYDVLVFVMPDDWNDPKWKEWQPHYCDRGYADDTHAET